VTGILGLKWNWVLEMGGISAVVFASEWRRRSRVVIDVARAYADRE
jgi:hypothetical protein